MIVKRIPTQKILSKKPLSKSVKKTIKQQTTTKITKPKTIQKSLINTSKKEPIKVVTSKTNKKPIIQPTIDDKKINKFPPKEIEKNKKDSAKIKYFTEFREGLHNENLDTFIKASDINKIIKFRDKIMKKHTPLYTAENITATPETINTFLLWTQDLNLGQQHKNLLSQENFTIVNFYKLLTDFLNKTNEGVLENKTPYYARMLTDLEKLNVKK